MKEFVTEAIVIRTEPRNEKDLEAICYTKDYGLLRLRVVSGRKITSKFAKHLNPLNIVDIRGVSKNRITLTDILPKEGYFFERGNPEILGEFLSFFFLLSSLAPQNFPDEKIWNFLVHTLLNKNKKPSPSELLKHFGYDPDFASCVACGAEKVSVFFPDDHSFFCIPCGLKIPRDRIIYV